MHASQVLLLTVLVKAGKLIFLDIIQERGWQKIGGLFEEFISILFY
jgi:hypothetical protein